jgi:hypothetical protein
MKQPIAWLRDGLITQDKELACYWAACGQPLIGLAPIEEHEDIGTAADGVVTAAYMARESRLAALNECLNMVKDKPEFLHVRMKIELLIEALHEKE